MEPCCTYQVVCLHASKLSVLELCTVGAGNAELYHQREGINQNTVIKSGDLSAPPGLCVSAAREPLIRLASRVLSARAEVISQGCGIRMMQDQQACAVSLIRIPCLSVSPRQVYRPPCSPWLFSLAFSPSVYPSLRVSSAPSIFPLCREKKTCCFDSSNTGLNVMYLQERL